MLSRGLPNVGAKVPCCDKLCEVRIVAKLGNGLMTLVDQNGKAIEVRHSSKTLVCGVASKKELAQAQSALKH